MIWELLLLRSIQNFRNLVSFIVVLSVDKLLWETTKWSKLIVSLAFNVKMKIKVNENVTFINIKFVLYLAMLLMDNTTKGKPNGIL